MNTCVTVAGFLGVLALSHAHAAELPRKGHGSSWCESSLRSMVGQRASSLMPLCRDSGMPADSCEAAVLVLAGKPLALDLVRPVCRELFYKAEVHEALLRRRGSRDSFQTGSNTRRAQSLLAMDHIVKTKHGTASYLVMKEHDEPPAPLTNKGPLKLTPLPATDNTVAKPPDADGNPFNEPTWQTFAPSSSS